MLNVTAGQHQCGRDGKEVQVNVPDMVLGDIVVLSTCDVVPVDLQLVVAHDVKVSEMAVKMQL